MHHILRLESLKKMSTKRNKYRKPYWDNRTPIEEVKEAAAKVNATLIANGKLKPSEISSKNGHAFKPNNIHHGFAEHSRGGGPIVIEVEINECPVYCRNTLTRGSTQDEISRVSDSAISTRGRFMTKEERLNLPDERPLYLCIQGPSQNSIDVAVQKVYHIVRLEFEKKGFNNVDLNNFLKLSSTKTQNTQTTLNNNIRNMPIEDISRNNSTISLNKHMRYEDKVPVNLEHAPPSFDVMLKVYGPSGQYLQHIQNESGAKVILRGRGSGITDHLTGLESTEPMNINIQHSTITGLQHAKQLANDLVQTVQKEFAVFQQALAAQQTTSIATVPAIVQTVDFYQSPVQSIMPHSVSLPNATLQTSNNPGQIVQTGISQIQLNHVYQPSIQASYQPGSISHTAYPCNDYVVNNQVNAKNQIFMGNKQQSYVERRYETIANNIKLQKIDIEKQTYPSSTNQQLTDASISMHYLRHNPQNQSINFTPVTLQNDVDYDISKLQQASTTAPNQTTFYIQSSSGPVLYNRNHQPTLNVSQVYTMNNDVNLVYSQGIPTTSTVMQSVYNQQPRQQYTNQGYYVQQINNTVQPITTLPQTFWN